jgi:hypothetical protein
MNTEEIVNIKQELKRLKQRNLLIQIAMLIILTLIIISSYLKEGRDPAFTRITAREIVIQDKHGNDRIIISPEIMSSHSRVRNDTLEGILILDKYGTDRIVLGATPTIQSSGTIVNRIDNSSPYGFVFNDSLGNERGGFGFYDSRGLVSFGMDNNTGEGLTMFVADDNLYGQKVGLVMQSASNGQVVYLGSNQQMETMLNLDAPGKGRLSFQIDSTAHASVKHFDYVQDARSVLLKSQ